MKIDTNTVVIGRADLTVEKASRLRIVLAPCPASTAEVKNILEPLRETEIDPGFPTGGKDKMRDVRGGSS